MRLKPMWIGIVTLFPEMFSAITDYGITGRSIRNGFLTIQSWNPRHFTSNLHQTVDDRPYGGGPGMLMMVRPLQKAIEAAKSSSVKQAKVIYLSPKGRRLDQSRISELAIGNQALILVCGRYEGIDERLIQVSVDEEWSIGDYVVSGGELPAMVLIDAISRYIPGVLGCSASLKEDSFSEGLLDHPQYTRPKKIGGIEVPSVLISGNHSAIRSWRLKQSLGNTWIRRPDLLERLTLTEEQVSLLADFKKEKLKK